MVKKKEKVKWDDMKFSLGEDRNGYTTFHYTFYLHGKMVDKLIVSDCSHKRANEIMFKHRVNKMYCVYNEEHSDPPLEPKP